MEWDAGPRRDAEPVDTGPSSVDAGSDAWMSFVDAGDGGIEEVACRTNLPVDLLIVLDDSGSLRPMDPLIRDRLERIVEQLLSPRDLDGDGVEDRPRVRDLHVGVATTSARGPEFCGHTQDGALMRGEPADLPYCHEGPYPHYVSYAEDAAPRSIARDVSCVAFGPRDGCTVEQPLEAMAKALLGHGAPFEYVAGEPRGDVENLGFLRDESVLVVLLIGDEDDCSVVDTSIFEEPEPIDAGVGRDAGRQPAPGCLLAEAGQLYAPERYVDILEWIRPGRERLVFAFVGGIGSGVTTNFEEDLGRCARTDYPSRIVEVARGLEGRAVGGSLCDLAASTFANAITDRVADAACL